MGTHWFGRHKKINNIYYYPSDQPTILAQSVEADVSIIETTATISGPTIDSLYIKIANLSKRLSELEAIINGGDIKCRTINGNIISDGSIKQLYTTDLSTTVIPIIHRSSSIGDGSVMEIGNIIDFHVRTEEHKTHANYCGRIGVNESGDIRLYGRRLTFTPITRNDDGSITEGSIRILSE